jgi:hypothetical protein
VNDDFNPFTDDEKQRVALERGAAQYQERSRV